MNRRPNRRSYHSQDSALCRSNRVRQSRRLSVQRLEQRQLLAADLGLVDEGLRSGFLDDLQSTINDQVLAAPAPFVGSALSQQLTNAEGNTNQFLSEIGDKLSSLDVAPGASAADVSSAIAAALGIDAAEIEVIGNDGDSEIRFGVSLADTFSQDAAIDLDLVGSDPELELLLGLDDAVDLEMSLQYELAFGVRENTDGVSEFFFDTTAADEVVLQYDATLRDDFDSGKGRIGVFIADYATSVEDASQFTGTYTLDVDLVGDSVAVLGSLSGAGSAHLDISADFFPNLDLGTNLINLGVTADGVVEYDTDIGFANGETSADNNQIIVTLDDVSIDLGRIYNDFVDPLLSRLQQSLQPSAPAIDFLTQPIPIISELSELLGRGEVTALALAGLTEDDAAYKAVMAIDAILAYDGLPGSALGAAQSVLSLEVPKNGFDPNAPRDRASEIAGNVNKLKNGLLEVGRPDHLSTPEGKAEFDNSLEWNREFGGAFDLPFLTDFDVLAGFLLGDVTSDLMTFGAEGNIGFSQDFSMPIAPLLNLVQLNAGLEVDASFSLAGGYDAYGIMQMAEVADFSSVEALENSIQENQLFLLNGFYMDDQNDSAGEIGVPENTDSDAAEVSLSVTLTGGLSGGLDLGGLKATVGGDVFLEGTLGLDLNDLPDPNVSPDYWEDSISPEWLPSFLETPDEWNYDGRIRVPELATIVEANPLAVVNVNGKLEAGLAASVEVETFGVTLVSERWELLRVTLLDGKLFEADDAVLIAAATQSQLGEVVDGELTLFMGDTADGRTDAAPDAINETFVIRSMGPAEGGGENLLVTFTPHEDVNAYRPAGVAAVDTSNHETYRYIFENVTSISAWGGSGNDSITIADGVLSDVMLRGGDGVDKLTVNSAGLVEIYGDDDNDMIVGGDGNDMLFGGWGDDYMDGRGGDDEMYGNHGDDKMFGGVGDDKLFGNQNRDNLDGGIGDDHIYGGKGHDILRGDLGQDTIYGQRGNDTIRYGAYLNDPNSLDILNGGDGVDSIQIYGTAQDDYVSVERLPQTDNSYEVKSADRTDRTERTYRFQLPTDATQRDIEEIRVTGLTGNDELSVVGVFDVNDVILEGGEGDDTLNGSDSSDKLYGGDGNDTLNGNGGNDELYGDEGLDTIRGGDGDDEIHGGDDNDTLYGELGFDAIYGGAGNDEIHGGGGITGDAINGEGGDDEIHGGDGEDFIEGGSGNDYLYGYGQNDDLDGGDGDDYLDGGVGRDVILGGAGNDDLFALNNPDITTESLTVSEIQAHLDAVDNAVNQSADLVSVIDSVNALLFHFATQPGDTENVNRLADALTLLQGSASSQASQAIASILRDLKRGSNDSVDALLGGEGNDRLVGTPDVDALMGGVGQDTIDGRGGKDRVQTSIDELDPEAFGNNEEVDYIIGGVSNDVFEIRGTDGDDEIRISQSESTGNIIVFIGVNAFQFASPDNMGFSEIRIDGLAGNDFITAHGSFDSLVYLIGGEGTDTLTGGDSANVIVGGNGSDRLFGGQGDDEIHGDAGDDNLYGYGGNDVLIGGTGKDSLSGDAGDDSLFALTPSVDWISSLLDLANGTTQPGSDVELSLSLIPPTDGPTDGPNVVQPTDPTPIYQPVENETLRGGAGNDRLLGTDGNDRLLGDDGDDVILHSLGDDVVSGGAGTDRYTFVFNDENEDIHVGLNASGIIEVTRGVSGQPGPVLLQTYDDNDATGIDALGIESRGGDDQLTFDFGDNTTIELHIDAGSGNDEVQLVNVSADATIVGGEGDRDKLTAHTGGDEADLLWSFDNEWLFGRATYGAQGFERLKLIGDDRDNDLNALFFNGETELVGGAGDDTLSVGFGKSEAWGGEGDDNLTLFVPDDALSSGSSISRYDEDVLNGDTTVLHDNIESLVILGSGEDNNIDMRLTSIPIVVDAFYGDDIVFGGSEDDVIHGGHGMDALFGEEGDDEIHGGDGVDTLYGSNGNDALYGGDGDDFLFGHNGNDALHGGGGDDLLHGHDGNDALHGGDGDDLLRGHDGNDALHGGGGMDQLYGDSGNDQLYGDDARDYLYGGLGQDHLNGGRDNDYLYGDEGDDDLYGGGGSDYLYGEEGDDYLDGGKDGTKDFLYGGTGFDTAEQYYERYYKFPRWRARYQESMTGIDHTETEEGW